VPIPPDAPVINAILPARENKRSNREAMCCPENNRDYADAADFEKIRNLRHLRNPYLRLL
jgi:hypothetical protein